MSANLIVQTAFLGDLLLSIPLFKRARVLWPHQKLFLVCRKGFGDFFKLTGLVDEVFEIKKGDAKSYQQALLKIKNYPVDHLISPHESWRTAFFCQKIKASKKITYKKFLKGWFFDEQIARDYRLPDPLRQLSLLASVDPTLKLQIEDYAQHGKPYTVSAQGRLTSPPAWASMGLREQFTSGNKIFTALKEKHQLSKYNFQKVVLLFPGSVWATKRWTEEGFIETGRALQSQGFQVIVMGGPGEEELSERVSTSIENSVCLAAQTSIYESALIIAHSALVIANDSAASHLASMCETPLITIFGPTIIEFGYRPWSPSTTLVETKGLSCRPCGKHGHKVCPIGTHACMKEITAETVLQKAKLTLR